MNNQIIKKILKEKNIEKNKIVKIKDKIFITLCTIILIPIVVNARYFEQVESFKGKGSIAEPIFKVQNLQSTILENIDKESKNKEYLFSVQNYVLEPDKSTKRASQVDMEYSIEVINEKLNFPIRCELYEDGKNENILNDNGKTSNILISKDEYYFKTYRLIVFWEDKEGVLESSDNIKIIINSSQVK